LIYIFPRQSGLLFQSFPEGPHPNQRQAGHWGTKIKASGIFFYFLKVGQTIVRALEPAIWLDIICNPALSSDRHTTRGTALLGFVIQGISQSELQA